MCKYIFSREIVDWEIRQIKTKKSKIVQARQASIYLGNWFLPYLSYDELGLPFKKNRCNVYYSLKTMKNLLYSDKAMRKKIDNYLLRIKKKINEETKKEAKEEVFQQNDFFIN